MKKYLTIKEKAQLVREGKDIPVCVYTDEKAEKKKKEKKKSYLRGFLKVFKY